MQWEPNAGNSPRHGPGPPLDAQMFPLNCCRFICCFCPRYKSTDSEIKLVCPTRLGVLIVQGPFAPLVSGHRWSHLYLLHLSGQSCQWMDALFTATFLQFLRNVAAKWAVLAKILLKVLAIDFGVLCAGCNVSDDLQMAVVFGNREKKKINMKNQPKDSFVVLLCVMPYGARL